MSRGAPRKRFLDIELALRWAYRDELPKRLRGGPSFADLSRPPRSDFFDDDGATREPGYPASAGEPHPDAMAIEAAVKSLETWRGHGFGPGDPAGLLHGIDHMEVDHIQAGTEAVASMAGIVACHARAGTRPKWSSCLPEPFPDRGPNGKPKVMVDETFVETVDKRGRVRFEPAADPQPGEIAYTTPVACPPTRKEVYRPGAYCPLVYRPAPAGLVAERAEWAAWRMGLELLYEALGGQLESIAVLPPSAPWRPWAGEGEAHGQAPDLFRGLREEPYRRETREQAAAKRRAAKRRIERDARAEETRPASFRQIAQRSPRGAKP